MSAGSPDKSPVQAAPKTARPAVKAAASIVALMISLVFAAVVAEVGLRYASDFAATQPTDVASQANPAIYTPEELRRDLPHFTERQGGKCLEIRPGLNWDPRFGFASKKLDKDCAKKLFAAYPKSVVLLGGSAMENNQAPNYLTTIDNYAFGGDDKIASLNLAESGARHANMLARFIHEIIELKPTYVVFFDGFNEFASARYGGNPEDDFYWTAGVRDRVEHPFRFLRDKLVEQSRLLQLLALKTGFINSARIVRDDVTAKGFEQAAAYYVKLRGYTETLCQANGIKCLFVIQPTALLEKTASPHTKALVADHLKAFHRDDQLFKVGYDYIFSHAGDKVMDASHLFEGDQDIFIDVVHFNKRGSKLVGEFIHAAVK